VGINLSDFSKKKMRVVFLTARAWGARWQRLSGVVVDQHIWTSLMVRGRFGASPPRALFDLGHL